MTTTTRLTAQYGSFVSERYPASRYFRKKTYLSVSGITAWRSWTILWFANPFPAGGANVTSATLSLRCLANANASHAITAQLCGPWSKSFYGLNWQTKPSGSGPRTDATKTGKLTAGQAWDIDLTAQMQTVASGAPLVGILLWGPSNNGDTVNIDGSVGRMPTLSVSWSTAPLPPTDLSPSGAAVVGTPMPTLLWNFTDHVGDTDLQAVEVQTATAETGFRSPSWDSGVVASTICQMDLSTTSFPAPAAGATVWWRVRNQDGSGIWSPWSDPVSWSWRALPAVTLVNPDPADTPVQVTDPTPPIDWTVTAGGGGQVVRWQAHLAQWLGGSWHTIDDSGMTLSTETRWTPKVAMKQGGTYQVWVRCWDGMSARRGVPGVPNYGQAFTNFTYTPTATVTAPSGLTIDVSDPSPKVTLEWMRSEQPDEWLILRDGVQLSRHDGDDFLAAGTSNRYVMRDALCPNGVHTWSVQAIVNGRASKAVSAVATEAHVGTWLCDEDTGKKVCIVGADKDLDMSMPETSTTLTPIGSPRSIVVVSGFRGYEDTCKGMLTTIEGSTLDALAQRDILLGWKTQTGHTFRLLVADMNIPVNISNVQVVRTVQKTAPRFTGDQGVIMSASFDWHQIGEYPFEVD